MLIRHGEKQVAPPPFSVDENGVQDKHSLLPSGWERAGALVAFFAQPTRPEIAIPRSIYAAAVDPSPYAGHDADEEEQKKSKRPLETIEPLARKLGLEPDKTYMVGMESALAKDIKTRQGSVLVCWEHKHIPLIAAEFTHFAPKEWLGERFDLVWVLDRKGDGTYGCAVVPQLLLAADSDVG